MSSPSADRVRTLILAECAMALLAHGLVPEELPDDFDLRTAGIIDSLGFLEIVVALERKLGVEFDFEAVDPEQLTVIGPLARHMAAEAAVADGALAHEAW